MEEFSSGQIDDVDNFLTNYVELRKLVHTRRVKVEKLTQQLREPQRRDFVSATTAAPPIPVRRSPVPPYPAPASSYPPPAAAHGFPPSVPYPPIGATNGWAQYPNGPAPVPFMQQ